MKKLGIIGARGYVGAELISLLAKHTGFELAAVSSRQLVGAKVSDHFAHPSALLIQELAAEDISPDVDAWVLALPNGHAAQWSEAIWRVREDAIVVDLSADFRFDDAWDYGLTEFNRDAIRASKRISNPGCYATAAQFALAPLVGALAATPSVFGVSGCSGAGTTPSPKNDPEQLRDNLMPYALVNHVHEREVSRHLKHKIHFMPHVAAFFRGISVTISAELTRNFTNQELLDTYRSFYGDEPLVQVSSDIPWVRDIAGKPHVAVGGFAVQDDHVVVVATIDNLLKGAATQALQNLNMAAGFAELEGIQ